MSWFPKNFSPSHPISPAPPSFLPDVLHVYRPHLHPDASPPPPFPLRYRPFYHTSLVTTMKSPPHL